MVLENCEEVRRILKARFITIKNASAQLNVNYEYLSKTISGFEGYRTVVTALEKAKIPVRIKSQIRKRKEKRVA